MDVMVHRQREFYLLESKWEKDPIEAAVIRELHGKLSNRVDVRGIVVSMSSFTSGAIQQVQDYASSRVIFLFGPGDVDKLVSGQALFEDLLDEKYTGMVTRRLAIVA
jgi:hypothetical protein